MSAVRADEQLLAGIRRRDAAALEAFYDRHHQAALGVALRLLRNRQLAEDVVQEAFMSVWRQAASYQGERGSARNWLLSIVHHRAVDRLRRDRPGVSVTLETLEATVREVADTEQLEVWEDVARNITRERVRAALRALPPEQRQTVELAYFGGLTCQQVAQCMQVPLGTAKGRMRLALQKLRALLHPEMLTDAPAAAEDSGGGSG